MGEHEAGRSFESYERPEDLVSGAVRAAVAVAREHGLRVDEPVVLADGFWAMVHLRPAPVVARVSTYAARIRPPDVFLARELAVAGHLAAAGAPVVTPSAELPPGPHRHGGHHVSFWTLLDVVPGAEVSLPECVALLGDLHAELRRVAGDVDLELPVLGPTAHDLPRCLPELDRAADLLSPAQLDGVRAAHERLAPFLADPTGGTGADLQVVHGDVHPGNVVTTPNGIVWIDFEDVCRAPREWDLALLSWMPDLDLSAHDPDPDLLQRCSDLRALHILTWMIRFLSEQGAGPAYDANITGCLPLLPETAAI